MNISSNVFISESWLWSTARSKIQHDWIDVSPVDDAHFLMHNSFVDWSVSYGDRISVKKLDQEICRNHPSPAKHHEQHEFILITWYLMIALSQESVVKFPQILEFEFEATRSIICHPSIPPNMLHQAKAVHSCHCRAFNFFSGARFSSSAYSSIHRNHGCQKIFFSWQRSKHFWIGHVA